MTPPASKAPRKPRSDALRNRERILDHAEKVFEAEGFEVSLHRIAEDLGLGIGTVYRHFPDHDHLLLGLHHRIQERMDESGRVLLALADPERQVHTFMDTTIDVAVKNPIARAVAMRVAKRFPEHITAGQWTEPVTRAVGQAQAAGAIRNDVDATDIAVLTGMLAYLAEHPEPQRSILIPRMRALVLDALRPEGAPRPPLPSSPISQEDIATITYTERAANQ